MVKNSGKILVVDDDADILISARMLLGRHFTSVDAENNPDQVRHEIRFQQYDAVLLDMNFSSGFTHGKEGLNLLQDILLVDPGLPVVMMTAFGDIDLAVKAIKEGAVDFVLKPWQNEKLVATISAAVRFRQSRLEIKQLKLQQKHLNEYIERDFTEFIGESPQMQQVYATVKKVAGTDANVLVLGENGTGKELVARALHNNSNRNGRPMVSVDLGAIPDQLFESELFGYAKGAFTDAKEDKAGRFEIANKSTLFLDEIGNLPFGMQSKLLTVLQNRKLVRLGSNKSIDLDIRLVSATNVPPDTLVHDRHFRQDLLYRINTIEIKLPPLRERGKDILLLAAHFLELYGKKYQKPGLIISRSAEKILEQYSWPGNVRELQHAIERAVILTENGSLGSADFHFLISHLTGNGSPVNPQKLDDLERSTIKQTLLKHGGNISSASRELGITRASLYRRIEKYGL